MLKNYNFLLAKLGSLVAKDNGHGRNFSFRDDFSLSVG